jgi:hypothetical protein
MGLKKLLSGYYVELTTFEVYAIAATYDLSALESARREYVIDHFDGFLAAQDHEGGVSLIEKLALCCPLKMVRLTSDAYKKLERERASLANRNCCLSWELVEANTKTKSSKKVEKLLNRIDNMERQIGNLQRRLGRRG